MKWKRKCKRDSRMTRTRKAPVDRRCCLLPSCHIDAIRVMARRGNCLGLSHLGNFYILYQRDRAIYFKSRVPTAVSLNTQYVDSSTHSIQSFKHVGQLHQHIGQLLWRRELWAMARFNLPGNPLHPGSLYHHILCLIRHCLVIERLDIREPALERLAVPTRSWTRAGKRSLSLTDTRLHCCSG